MKKTGKIKRILNLIWKGIKYILPWVAMLICFIAGVECKENFNGILKIIGILTMIISFGVFMYYSYKQMNRPIVPTYTDKKIIYKDSDSDNKHSLEYMENKLTIDGKTYDK